MLRTISCLVSLVISVCIFSFRSFAQLPTATLSGTQTVCMIQPAQLTVTFTGTAPWSFSYTDGSISGTISGVTQNPYVWSQATSTPLTTFSLLSVSDKNYSSGTVSGSVAVSWRPSNFLANKIPLTLSGPNPIYCPLGTTVLSTTPGYAKYRWFLGDTELSTEIGSSLTVTAAGTYMVTAIDASCNIQSSLAITVSITEPFAKPVISGNITLQCGTTTTLTATANFAKYDWMLNNAIVQSGSLNTINVNTYGEGSYTVKVYDATGCTNTSAAFRVAEVRPTLNSFPENPLGLVSLRCQSGNNVLTATAGFNRYDWMLNGSVVKSSTDNSIDAAVVGAGSYSVKVYYPGGCTSTSRNYPIQFQTSPPVPSITATSTLMCPGQIVSVSTNGLAGFASYLWSDGSTFNQINVSEPGTYTVTATDFAGCTSNNSITISTPANFQDVTIAAVGPSTVCQQNPEDGVLLQSTGTYSGCTYFWKKNGAPYNNPGTANYMSATESGTYTLNLVPSSQIAPSVCYNTSNSIDVFVTAAPVTSNAIYLCGALPSYSYTSNGAGPNQRYKWYASYNSSTALYTSTGPADNTYSHTSNLVYVSIYDPISRCETYRTPLGYLVDPTTLADKVTTICSKQTTPAQIATPISSYSYVGTHKWYTVASGGTPVYTSKTNVYDIPRQDGIFYVEFLSDKGCQTNRAMYTVKYVVPPTPVLSAPISCAGSPAIVTPNSSETGLIYYMYDAANNYVTQTITSFSIPVPASGTKTYYIGAIKDGCEGQRASTTIDAANVTPVPVNNVSFTALCDQSATVTFTGTALPSATFNWDFQGATIISGSGVGPYKIRWATAGKKIVVLQVIQNGCSSPQYGFSYTVPTSPVPSFTLPTAICQNTTSIALTGSPAGGVFSGTGIAGNTYTPSIAGASTITYTYTNPADACVYTATKSVTVNPLPIVSIAGLNTSYCQSTTGVPVTVSPVGGTLSGTGIGGTTFTPSATGQRTITYAYTDANSCSNTATQSVTVNPVPVASFTGLNANYYQCNTPVTLTGTPAGGVFSGMGVNGNSYTPSTLGTNTVTYSYIVSGCGAPVVKSTTVIAALIPSVAIVSSTLNTECGKTITYTATLENIPASRTIQWLRNGLAIAGANGLTYTSSDISNGEKIVCKVTFVDACANIPVSYLSNVYIQAITSLNAYIKFDGTDDRLTIPAMPQYDLGGGDFTMGAFINLNATAPSLMPLISKRSSSVNGFALYLSGNQLLLKINGISYYSNSFNSIKDKLSHYVAVSRKNGVLTFYLDGNAIGNDYSALSINSTGDLIVGRDLIDNVSLKGNISNVYLSNLPDDFIVFGPLLGPRTSEGIVGYWTMNDCAGQNIIDMSNYGNTGILGTSTAVESSDPIFEAVLPFASNVDGVDFRAVNAGSRIEIPALNVYNFGTATDFTIEARIVALNSSASNQPTIISNRNANPDGYRFGIYQNKLFFQTAGVKYYDAASYDLTQSYCNHVAITRSGTTYTFYVNGKKTSSFTCSANLTSNRPLWLGNDFKNNDRLNGILDELRIWSTAQSEIFLFANMNTVYFPETTPNLIAYFTFKDAKNAQWVLDGSSFDNHGFLGSDANAVDLVDPLLITGSCNISARMANDVEDDILETESVQTVLYPNPFQTSVRLRILNLNARVSIHVLDAEGRVVYTQDDHPANEELIFGDELPQGLYYVQFINQPDLKPIKFIKMR